MATCNLCPPGAREFSDAEMPGHLRTVHPEVDVDGTRAADNSRIIHEGTPGTGPDPGGEWRSSAG
jgi:hypothetical protein